MTTSTADPYEVLNVSRTATAAEIRRAYRRKALVLHPDKHVNASPVEQEKLTAEFQAVSRAFGVLSDDARRARYDRTGSTEAFPFEGEEDGEALAKFFEELYKGMVTEERISEYEQRYVGSEEEKKDVLEAYEKSKGDMNAIVDTVLFSNCDAETRFVEVIDAAIASGTTSAYPKYKSTNTAAAKKARRKKEAKEVEEFERAQAQEKKKGKKADQSEADLQQLMLRRGEQRMQDLISGLEAKYGKGNADKSGLKRKSTSDSKNASTKKRRSKSDEESSGDLDDLIDDADEAAEEEEEEEGVAEPTEEEFQAAQQRLLARSKSSKSNGSTSKTKQTQKKEKKAQKDSETTKNPRRSSRVKN